MITVECRECGEMIESMWLTPNEIATCSDCGGM